MGNRWFDLGNFAVNNELGPAEEEAFVTAYLDAPPAPADLAALRLMRLMSDFREAMWGVVQVAISDLDFDFAGYATKHFDRLLAAIDGDGFETLLEDAHAAG
jgi:thiamine kinase-like enzyme